MMFNAAAEFPKAGLTPDENGEYKMGMSEMARFSAYQEQQQRDKDFQDWMDQDD
jgi:hypothetical protein